MTNPFPVVIESPADLWSGLDALLAWVEANGRAPLNEHISRMARLRQAVFDPVPEREGVVDNSPVPALRLAALPEDEPGKPDPAEPPAPVPQGPIGAGREPAATRRRAIAVLLANIGSSLTSREIAERLNIPLGSMSAVLTHPWFAKGPGKRAPYFLTAAGLEMVRALPEEPRAA